MLRYTCSFEGARSEFDAEEAGHKYAGETLIYIGPHQLFLSLCLETGGIMMDAEVTPSSATVSGGYRSNLGWFLGVFLTPSC